MKDDRQSPFHISYNGIIPKGWVGGLNDEGHHALFHISLSPFIQGAGFIPVPILFGNMQTIRGRCLIPWATLAILTDHFAGSIGQGSRQWLLLVESVAVGSVQSIMTSHQMQRILCPSSLMRCVQSLSGDSSGTILRKNAQKIGTTCRQLIIAAIRQKATKSASGRWQQLL